MNAVSNKYFEELMKKQKVWEALLAEQEDRPLIWEDIPEEHIHRFGLEDAGRCYAANPPLDRILFPLRRVYEDYRKKAEEETKQKDPDACFWWWNGEVSDPKWPSSVMLSELQAADKEE